MKYEKNNEAFEFDEDWANRHNQQSQSISGSGSSKTAHEIDGSELVKGSMKPRDYAMVGVLFVVNLLNYMDRYTVAGVLTNVQRHFCINDEWGGFLQTIFIVSYLLFAPIIGYLGDRYSRKVLIIWGLAVWISSVLGSSFIPGYTPEIDPVSGKTLNHNYNFVYFLICRGLVGIGEASYSTIAPAMLSDMFTSTTRSKVLMLFYIAIPVGSGLGYMVGSKVAELAIQWGAVDGWQWGLRVTPALGMICIFCLIFIVREPERGQAEKNAGATMIVKRTSYIKDIGYLLKHKTYISATLGFTAVTFVTGTLAWWAPTAVNYAYQWQKDSRSTTTLAPSTVMPIVTTNTTILSTCENGDDIPKDPSVDLIFGALTCVAGLLGVVVATMISKLWKEGKFCFRRIKTVRADAILCAIGSVLAIAPLFGGLHTIAHLPGLSWVLIFCAITFLCLNWAILTDMLMYTVLPHRRSTASALQISISHLFGDASGPWIIGAVSDAIRGTDGSAKAHFNSLLTAFYIPIAAVVVSAIMFLVSIYTVKEDVERFQATMGMIEKPKANIDTNFVVLKGKDTGHENATFAQE